MKRLERPAPIRTQTLDCSQTTCPHCGGPTWLQYRNRRQVLTLQGIVALDVRVRHFLKVTRSYRPGLLYCYDDPAIPRTNNDLEHCFGQYRFHERRASGRKRGAPNAVLHGAARQVASVATRLRPYTADELVPHDRAAWQKLRQSIRRRFALRAQGQRFRRDPNAYLAQLEADFLKPALPA
jgi:hypothetical protein